MDQEQPLHGMRVLVADDEIMIAMNLEEGLREVGAEVWSAGTVASALECIESASLTGAVLDVRLGTEDTEAVADALVGRGVPFVFYSGRTLPDGMRRKYPGTPALIKPLRQSQIVDALLAACSAKHGVGA